MSVPLLHNGLFLQGRILFQPLQAYCPLWGAKPARFWFSVPSMEVLDFHLRPRACLVAILAWHFCPTSARDAPHSWLISPWSNHECTTTTHGSGRGMPCTQVLATKSCGCQALQATRSSPWPKVKISKADNTWDGHCPQKATFCGNTIYLSALEAGHGHA